MCAMPRVLIRMALVLMLSFSLIPPTLAQSKIAPLGALTAKLRARHSSPLDLELGGKLRGIPPGETRYLAREDLLSLPQVSFTTTQPEMFSGPTRVSGITLDELVRALGGAPVSDMVVAIAYDGYRANYPSSYIAFHHPLLVLEIDGKAPPDWPKDAEHHTDIGPYTVAYKDFVPRFKIFAHADEPQIPWGVVRIELRDEHEIYGAIAPHDPLAVDPAVQAGYRVAQQNCFRCHNAGREGGQKSERPWLVLSAWATASPDFFTAYVRNPQSKNPLSQMPGNPDYDDSTMRALIAYFRAFQAPVR